MAKTKKEKEERDIKLAALAQEVIEQKETLKTHTRNRAEVLEKLRKDEIRVTYLKDYKGYELFGERLSRAVEMLLEIKTEWNQCKAIMDDSCAMYGVKDDAAEFDKAYTKMCVLFYKHGELNDLTAKIKQTRSFLSMDSPLKKSLVEQVDFMTRVRDNAKKVLADMHRSPAQIAGNAAKASSMRARWGSY